MDKPLRVVELFAGIGGFRLGLEQALGKNVEIVYVNEWDKYAAQTYEKNFCNIEYTGSRNLHGGNESNASISNGDGGRSRANGLPTGHPRVDTRSITDVPIGDIPEHDLLVGGFPCQAFSVAGKRGGFEDTRGTLFFEIARIAKAKKPKYMLLENVKGLISHDKGRTLTTILESLQELGYYVNWEIHNSKDYGVPQNRERIFLLCRHISVLASVGQNQRITSSEKIIQEYLFQLLLNNLKEVQKLQGLASKDWVVGWLLLKEMSQNPKSKDENIMAGIITPMEGSIFQSKGEEVWQNIDIWLNKNLGVNCSEVNISTISTVIKKITESGTYTFLQMQECIWLAIAVLRKLQPSLWNEVLLSLTVIQEDTKYARINYQNKEAIITENSTAHDPSELQDPEKYFSLGHLRGTSRPQVFPIQGGNPEDTEQITSTTIDANYWKGIDNHGQRTAILELKQVGNIDQKGHNSLWGRVYSPNGVSSTLNAHGGGLGAKTGLYAMRWKRTEEGKRIRSENQKKGKDYTPFNGAARKLVPIDDGIIGTITSQAISKDSLLGNEYQIRRLTPIECERLQGFEDNWTAGVSDTQRYKQLGNAVSVPVIYEIAKRAFSY